MDVVVWFDRVRRGGVEARLVATTSPEYVAAYSPGSRMSTTFDAKGAVVERVSMSLTETSSMRELVSAFGFTPQN